jgi:uncharacterized heparinase superfamily protein
MTVVQLYKKLSEKPLDVIVQRICFELKLFTGQFTTPLWARSFSEKKFLMKVNYSEINVLWDTLSSRPFVTESDKVSGSFVQNILSGEYEHTIQLAERACNNRLELLGTGLIYLGDKIDWHKDYKSNIRWAPSYIRKIKYSNPDDPSDVKIPWEISRMQWLIPVGQAYLLTRDEKYAQKVKEIITHWISENPYAGSVNWTCTMEAAIRIFTWTWFFHVFKASEAWSDKSFRALFLKNLWMHGKFTEEHIERSDVNGNHFTADASAMVMAGLFFGVGEDALRWGNRGWEYLENEMPKQVFLDGVNYEASVPYHRLVLELFLYPALYRIKLGNAVSEEYRSRLKNMAWFSILASRQQGSVPVWGDADDARALPFRFEAINDHRYLSAMVGIGMGYPDLTSFFAGPITEILWLFGEHKSACLLLQTAKEPGSSCFDDGGFYILRDRRNHVFIDCGPLGLAGRGGHGHNDILSFEAYLKDKPLIVDCGSYLYTANYTERNNFRSTAYHNTPQIDGQEINRFIRWDYLWNLQYDAIPNLLEWSCTSELSKFKGTHTGYDKLRPALKPVRSIALDHSNDRLFLQDKFEGDGVYPITIPFHLHPDVILEQVGKAHYILISGNEKFHFLNLSEDQWDAEIQSARVSFSYGRILPTKRIVFRIERKNNPILKVVIFVETTADIPFNIQSIKEQFESVIN